MKTLLIADILERPAADIICRNYEAACEILRNIWMIDYEVILDVELQQGPSDCAKKLCMLMLRTQNYPAKIIPYWKSNSVILSEITKMFLDTGEYIMKENHTKILTRVS